MFVLIRNAKGRHYQEFVRRNKPLDVVAAQERAFKGTMGGHTPVAGEQYCYRPYPLGDRILFKLTKKV